MKSHIINKVAHVWSTHPTVMNDFTCYYQTLKNRYQHYKLTKSLSIHTDFLMCGGGGGGGWSSSELDVYIIGLIGIFLFPDLTKVRGLR